MNTFMLEALESALASLIDRKACIEAQISTLREALKGTKVKSKSLPTSAKKPRRRRKNNVSPESRAKISAAQKARWEAFRVGAAM